MPRRYHLSLIGSVVVALLAGSAHGADKLTDAYAAILRGDYQAGRTTLNSLLRSDEIEEPARQTVGWLDRYSQVLAARDDLRRKTFDWSVEQARQALSKDKPYLALTFAAQAALYAEDEDAFARLDWLKQVRQRGLREAQTAVEEEKWLRANRYYSMLQRLDEDDQEVRELRERTLKHARLALLYDDAEAVERRIAGVNFDLLNHSLRLIDSNYYQQPDYRKMATGALESLIALCGTKSLYDEPDSSRLFDGVANPASREHFLGEVNQMLRKVRNERGYDYQDIIRLYQRVRAVNNESISLPEPLLIIEFVEGALGELDDFTSVVWPADSEEFTKLMMGEFVGVGIQLGLDELTERLKVVTPLENSPALRAGIQPGDLIIAVDGGSTAGWTTDKAVREITGPEGTQVVLTMFRPRTGQELEFPLKRSPIQLTTIRGVKRSDAEGKKWDYMLDPDAGIAYIRLTNFNPDSHQELRSALNDARAQGMQGLILDLRGNPGGLLDVAVQVVSLFVPRGEIVSTRGRVEETETHTATGRAPYHDLPLVVLVNEASASASEILAGALQDYHRAVVFGDRTFGKGSVQRVLSLNRRLPIDRPRQAARLKLTTALYYLPSGRSPHKESDDAETWGVDPDLKVELTPKEFTKVMEQGLEAFIIHNEHSADPAAQQAKAEADAEARQARIEKRLAELKAEASGEGEDEDDPALLSEEDIALIRSDPHEADNLDPQLEKALLHMRIKLAADLPWPSSFAANTDNASALAP